MWLHSSTENKLIIAAMFFVVVGLFSQITRISRPRRGYRGRPSRAAAMGVLADLELQNVKGAYRKAREFSRRYRAVMQLSDRIPKEDVEPEYNIYVPVNYDSELSPANYDKLVREWISANPGMRGIAERAQRSCESALEFEKALIGLPEPEARDEFDSSLMRYDKYIELEDELVQDALKNARPLSPRFVFHFYCRGSKRRSISERTKEFTPESLMAVWKDAEACSGTVQ